MPLIAPIPKCLTTFKESQALIVLNISVSGQIRQERTFVFPFLFNSL